MDEDAKLESLRTEYVDLQSRASRFGEELVKQLNKIIAEQDISLGFPIPLTVQRIQRPGVTK